MLHTSDVHLTTLGDPACESLKVLIDLALETNVDLVVIAGDLFDHNRVKDDLVSYAIEQLKRLPVTVLILPGNHDCLTSDSVYLRTNLWQSASNVQIFRDAQGETLTLPEPGISAWGKPLTTYENDIRPLSGVTPSPQNGHWRIAIAHGYYVDQEPFLFPGYLITEQEIASSGQDYIALGHCPVFRCISSQPVKAYYSGSPSFTGLVTIVDFSDETGVQVTRYALSNKQPHFEVA